MPQSSIDIGFKVTTDRSIPEKDRIRQLIDYAAQQENSSGELGIWLCTDDEIAELHLQFMNIPGATDVITFPSGEEYGGYLGDIAVSVDTAAEQAIDSGHSVGREVGYLCLHGFLHLMGYDDLDPDDRHQMIERQDALLGKFEQEHSGGW
jgi:probable rRNA maturation factor